MNVPSLFMAVLLASCGMAFAADPHEGHGAPTAAPSAHEAMVDPFMVKKEIDGYTVTFHVMPSADDMKSMGADSLMVKIEKGGVVVAGVIANSKVIFPDGREETKPMMVMGDWLMAGYDLAKEGRHQLMVLFKTADGQKRFGGVWYPQPK
ncbi:MAG: hypothetical protein HQK87_00890 [Nitrospinae bacterium]|nr:hypothetical protein [Nitrospinota bacterium]